MNVLLRLASWLAIILAGMFAVWIIQKICADPLHTVKQGIQIVLFIPLFILMAATGMRK